MQGVCVCVCVCVCVYLSFYIVYYLSIKKINLQKNLYCHMLLSKRDVKFYQLILLSSAVSIPYSKLNINMQFYKAVL